MSKNEIYYCINGFLKWKISKRTSYIVGNNWTKFRKWITRGKFVHFRSTIDTSRSRTGYNLSYSFSLKKFLCFNLRKKRCSEASHFKVRSSLSFSNLEVSEIISWIALWKSFWSEMTTLFLWSGFVIMIRLSFFRVL